jgi:hypothetical protein
VKEWVGRGMLDYAISTRKRACPGCEVLRVCPPGGSGPGPDLVGVRGPATEGPARLCHISSVIELPRLTECGECRQHLRNFWTPRRSFELAADVVSRGGATR